MGNDNNVTLVNQNNPSEYTEIDLLCAFEFENNKYIVYSKNEHDYDGNIIVYVGKICFKNNMQYIVNVDKSEYDKIKDIIKKMVDYNSEVAND